MSNAVKIGIAAAIIIVGGIVSLYAIQGLTTTESITTQSQIDLQKYRESSHTLGSLEAPITIIEFGDYQCPFCSDWYKDVKPDLTENYVDKGHVELIFVDFPFLGPDSFTAGYASFCAQEQDLYWEFHETLYLNQQAPNDGWANPENLREFAKSIGMNLEKYDTCMMGTQYQDDLNSNMAISEINEVNQTPTFVVAGPNGQMQKIEGKQPLIVFEEIFAEFEN